MALDPWFGHFDLDRDGAVTQGPHDRPNPTEFLGLT